MGSSSLPPASELSEKASASVNSGHGDFAGRFLERPRFGRLDDELLRCESTMNGMFRMPVPLQGLAFLIGAPTRPVRGHRDI